MENQEITIGHSIVSNFATILVPKEGEEAYRFVTTRPTKKFSS